jgi:hypothetical protein
MKMKIKAVDLIGPALDWAVASIEKRNKHGVAIIIVLRDGRWLDHDRHLYSTHWDKGGPLKEREGIATRQSKGKWYAMLSADLGDGERAQ